MTVAATAQRRRNEGERRPTEHEEEELDKSMEGVENVEDCTLWKILGVQWDDEQGTMVVLYYDLQAVKDHGISEADLLDDEDYIREYAEYISLKAVGQWMADSRSKGR